MLVRSYDTTDNFEFNWSLLISSMGIWCLIGLVMTRGIQWVSIESDNEFAHTFASFQIGKANRYISISLMITLLMFVVKALFVHNLVDVFATVVDSTHIRPHQVGTSSIGPLICFQTFGRGWGTPLAMASYNDFKSKVHHLSLATVVGSLLLTLAGTLVTVVFYGMLSQSTVGFDFPSMHPQTSLYVAFPSVFGTLPYGRVWLTVFFLMITLSEISSIIIQLTGLLTSFFDEFDEWRIYKTGITNSIIGFLALKTIFYCSNVWLLNFISIFVDKPDFIHRKDSPS